MQEEKWISSSRRLNRQGARHDSASFSALQDRSGATAIEYSILAAGIAMAIIATVQGLGTNVNGMFGTVLSALK
jgi:pilus assembly protein Flp/PilA